MSPLPASPWRDGQEWDAAAVDASEQRVYAAAVADAGAASPDPTVWRNRVGYYNLKDEGVALTAIGAASIDQRTAFLTVLQAAAIDGKEVYHPGGVLGMNSKIVTQLSALRLRGNGPDVSIIQQNAGSSTEHMIDIGLYGSLYSNSTNLTADALQGTSVLTMTSVPSAYTVGDLVEISSTEVWPWSDKGAVRGELGRVAGKTGTTITLEDRLDDNYTVATTAKVRKLASVHGGLVTDIGLVNATPATHTEGLLRLAGFVDPRIEDVWMTGADRTGLCLEACVNPRARVRCFDFNDSAPAGRYAYGVEARGTTRGGFIDVYMRRGRHAFTTTADSSINGIPRHITADVEGTRMTNAVADTHPEGDQINLRKVRVYQTKAWGIQMRAPNGTLTDGIVHENVGYACWVRGSNCKIVSLKSSRARTGNIVSIATDVAPGPSYDGQGLRIGDGPVVSVDDGEYRNITIDDPDAECIYFGTAADRNTVDTPILRRPGRGGLSTQAIRTSGTAVGNRLYRPQFFNCPLCVFGVTGHELHIDDPVLESCSTFLGGTTTSIRVSPGRHMFAPSAQGWTGAGGVFLTDNQGYFNRFIPERDMLIVAMALWVSTADVADVPFSIGISDATMTPLTVTGALTSASGAVTGGGMNSTGRKRIALPAAQTLKKGQPYYPAFSIGDLTGLVVRGATYGNTETVQMAGTAVGQVDMYGRSTSHPLPGSQITTGLSAISIGPLLYLLEA